MNGLQEFQECFNFNVYYSLSETDKKEFDFYEKYIDTFDCEIKKDYTINQARELLRVREEAIALIESNSTFFQKMEIPTKRVRIELTVKRLQNFSMLYIKFGENAVLTDSERRAAIYAYAYVEKHSGRFTCTMWYLGVLWEAALINIINNMGGFDVNSDSFEIPL